MARYGVPCLLIPEVPPTEEAPLLEEFMGVPIHPLLVHAPVVFIPLLALLAFGYALVARVRPHTRWVLGLLALATPVSALLAKLSGDAFFRRLQSRNQVTPEFRPKLLNHQELGTFTLYAAIVLGLLVLAMVLVIAPGQTATGAMPVVLRILSLVAAVVAVYYVVRTGDSGGKAVWTGS